MEVRSYINVSSLKTFQSKLSVTTRHPQQFRGPQALASPRCLLMTLSLWRPDHNSRKTGHIEILQQDRRVRKDKSELFIPCSLCTEPVASLSAASLGTRGRRRGRAWVVRVRDNRRISNIHQHRVTLAMCTMCQVTDDRKKCPQLTQALLLRIRCPRVCSECCK